MLNRILANYLDVETPESTIENVFKRMEEFFLADDGMRFVNNASLSMASVASSLKYRYNPTLKYSVELFPAGDLGQLKISLRSKNPVLFDKIEKFYSLYVELERSVIGERTYFYQDGRFTRVFLRPLSASAEEIGESISSFVKEFDEYLKIYFLSDDESQAARKVAAAYADNISKKKVIL